MRILFVDACCPKAYDPKVLRAEALGGTEATVIRIAESLSNQGHDVTVKQHCRSEQFLGAVRYAPFGYGIESPSHVVVLRTPQALIQARKQFPTAKLYLWAHDMFGGPGWVEGFKAVKDTNASVITVSDWHRSQMFDAMRQLGVSVSIPCRTIYNPIDDVLAPDSTPIDANKLVFFSSPHKGLEHTLKIFERFKDFEELKNMRLYIANPGYFNDHKTEGLHNVINLGSIPHAEIIQHVRSALAVFHLNAVFPETFGLVHAEANAVGTPFLTSRIGAAYELCDHPAELVDVMDPRAVIERITMWTKYGRPKVRGNVAFRTHRVVKEWIEVLTR